MSRSRTAGTGKRSSRVGVNKANPKTGLPTQMSHDWISYTLPGEKLTFDGKKIFSSLRDYKVQKTLRPDTVFPYYRWISLVTGRQFEKHRKTKGSTHDIQIIMELPNSILEK